MTRHVITIPPGADGPHGGGYELVWDNEAGTIAGDPDEAGRILYMLQELGIPTNLSGHGRTLILQDPLHDPRDFWHLLPWKCQVEPLRSTMPAILRETEPTPVEATPPPMITVDGVRRAAVEGVDFVW